MDTRTAWIARHTTSAAALLVSAAAAFGHVAPDTFWAMDARTGALYEVDLNTQSLTMLDGLVSGVAPLPAPGGGAAFNNSLYITNPQVGDGAFAFHRVDIERGDLDVVAPLPVGGDAPRALTADTEAGALFSVGRSFDTLYVTRVLEGDSTTQSLGVVTPESGAPFEFGRAVGAAFDVQGAAMYVITDNLPTETLHLWRLDVAADGDPSTTAIYIGDTGIDSEEDILPSDGVINGGQDAQTGLAFNDASGDLVLSSAHDLTVEFYTIDPATAQPTLEFIFPERLALDSLAPAHVGYTVLATSDDIPVAISADQDTGEVFVVTDGNAVTTPIDDELQPVSPFAFFFAGLEPGTDIEFGSSQDTGNPDAVYAVNNDGELVIVPFGASPFSIDLAGLGITTGEAVGTARRGQDIYFTAGGPGPVGPGEPVTHVPGALYKLNSDGTGISLVSTNLEDSATALEYVEATDTFYYTTLTTLEIYAYDPASDQSTLVGRPPIGSLTPNFAIDPQGRFAYIAEDDRISAIPIDPGAAPSTFVFADNLPMNRSGHHDLVFAPSSDGSGGVSLYVAVNGRQHPAPPQVLEFAGFNVPTAEACGPADLTTDGSSSGVPDGVVTLSDFSFYLSLWSASDPEADVTTDGLPNGEPDGEVTLSDFSYYLSLWSEGCP
ncbi:MAG: GC-type dockerin domain-anchored protein [Planctomycetota bacterium]